MQLASEQLRGAHSAEKRHIDFAALADKESAKADLESKALKLKKEVKGGAEALGR